jgi:hypothetical protein
MIKHIVLWTFKESALGKTKQENLDLPPKYVPPSVLLFSCGYGYLGV